MWRPRARRRYEKRSTSDPYAPWRLRLAAFGKLLERQGFSVKICVDGGDPTDGYIRIGPNFVVQVAWDHADAASVDEPATYGVTIETPYVTRHLGYMRSFSDVVAAVATQRPIDT